MECMCSVKILLRNEVCNILKSNQIHKSQHITKDFRVKFLRHRVEEVKDSLKENQNLLDTVADKGNIIVIITKEEYSRNMDVLFSDERSYITQNRDPTETLQNKMIILVLENCKMVERICWSYSKSIWFAKGTQRASSNETCGFLCGITIVKFVKVFC